MFDLSLGELLLATRGQSRLAAAIEVLEGALKGQVSCGRLSDPASRS
jgi:hypothetical protein